MIKAVRKERKQRRKKKKYEKSLFCEWLAKEQEKQDAEKQKPNQKKAENPNGAAQEQILAQKREIDETRAQAAKVKNNQQHSCRSPNEPKYSPTAE